MAKLNKNFVITSNDLASAMSGDLTHGQQTESIDDTPKLVRALSGKNKGLPIGEERVSFILLDDQYEKIQAIAYWERQTLKETVIEIFKKAIDEYEAKNGTIRPKPKKKR